LKTLYNRLEGYSQRSDVKGDAETV